MKSEDLISKPHVDKVSDIYYCLDIKILKMLFFVPDSIFCSLAYKIATCTFFTKSFYRCSSLEAARPVAKQLEPELRRDPG